MDPDAGRDGAGGHRQRLATGIAIALAIGLALSFALGSWTMLLAGVGLGVVLWAGSGGEG